MQKILPINDINRYILDFLDIKELYCLSQTNKYYYNIVNQNILFKNFKIMNVKLEIFSFIKLNNFFLNACYSNNFLIFNYLIKQNIDFTMYKNKAIELASQKGNFKIIKVLLDMYNKNNINICIDNFGFYASRYNYLEILKYFDLIHKINNKNVYFMIKTSCENDSFESFTFLSNKFDYDIIKILDRCIFYNSLNIFKHVLINNEKKYPNKMFKICLKMHVS